MSITKSAWVTIACTALVVTSVVVMMHQSNDPGTLTVDQTNKVMTLAVPAAEKQMGVTQGQLCFSISLQGLDVGTDQVVAGYDHAAPDNQKHLNKPAVRQFLANLCAADLAPSAISS